MKAIVIDEASPGRELRWEEVPEPQPGATDLVVAVRATGLNRADLRRAATHFAATDGRKPAAVAGLELAGEVIGVGPDTTGFKVGDRVMAMAGNAFAEKVALDHRFAIRVPATMSWENAAATPISFITAHNALVTAGAFRRGETVLVQAASSGAGIATVQIARQMGASTIFGTAGSAEKLQRLRDLGCNVTINYRQDSISEVVRERTDSLGTNVVVDYAGGDTFRSSIDAAAVRGRIVCAGRVAGVDASFNLDEFSRKQLQMTGVTNRTRTLPERVEVVRAFRDDLMRYIEEGELVPVVDSVYPLRDAESAYQRMTGNTHFGKIVLTL